MKSGRYNKNSAISFIATTFCVAALLFFATPARATHRVPLPSGSVSSKPGPGLVDLLSPNGGERLDAGQPYIIKWKQSGQKSIDSVSIYYFKRDQKEELITLRYYFNPLVLEESFTWRIPEILGDEYESYRIALRGYKNDVLVSEDKSEGYFTITPPGQIAPEVLSVQLSRSMLKINMAFPNGGDAFKRDNVMTIRWSQKYLNFIDIGLVTKDATDKTSDTEINWIVKDFKIHPNSVEGTYSWQIPKDEGFRDVYYKLYIVGRRSNLGEVSDMSDDFFTITKDGTANVGAQLLEYPETVNNNGEKAVFMWTQSNVDSVSLWYSGKPIDEKSVFSPIVENYAADAADAAARYEWSVPGPNKIPQGYYAVKIVGNIKNHQVSEDISKTYVWIGDAKAPEYQGVQKTPSKEMLEIETAVKKISQSAVQIDWEDKGGNLRQGTAAVEYGLTLKYGQSKPFTVSQKLSGGVTLENLTRGAVYHYRILQGNLASADADFGFEGAVSQLGYAVLNRDKKGMSVKLQWRGDPGTYGVHFCKDICSDLSRWEKVGETIDTTYLATNDLLENQSGSYWVLRTMPGAFEHMLGARIAIVNTAQAQAPIVAPSVLESVIIKNGEMFKRVTGKILLKIQASGEAYYVSPLTSTAYYLGRPNQAFDVMRSLGIGITNKDLEKIPVGIGPLTGRDTDSDGLSDDMEAALGTSITDKDTDGDGFTDKLELELNTSPTKKGANLSIDKNFVDKHKGKIFLQTERQGQAWYLNPADGKRYYLGKQVDAINIMRSLGIGISNKDFSRL
jgi:hypothetical protein